VYPIYATLGVYSRKGTQSEVNFWLQYWTIRSFLIIIEFAFSSLLEYVPYLDEVRCIIYFLLIFTAEGVYRALIEPFLLSSESHIDGFAESTSAHLSRTLTTIS
jgi:hypothetical protein